MKKISRAGDNIWSTGAFDPRKPVDPDWADRAPSPVLRSGDESRLLEGSPEPHDHTGDAMHWGGDTPEPFEPDGQNQYVDFGNSNSADRVVPDHDLVSIGRHGMKLVTDRLGKFEGSQGHYVEYPTGSSVSHYYTYHPSHDHEERWSLNSHHSLLRDPITTYHPTFKSAILQASFDKSDMESQADREWPPTRESE